MREVPLYGPTSEPLAATLYQRSTNAPHTRHKPSNNAPITLHTRSRRSNISNSSDNTVLLERLQVYLAHKKLPPP